MNHTSSNLPARYFRWVIDHPKSLVLFSLLLMAVTLVALPQLTKDTRSDAFMAPDNPALVYRDKVKSLFGLADPMVIAVVSDNEKGIYTPESLALVDWLSDKVSRLENIDPERVMSLATENNIVGSDFGMDVDPFFDFLSSRDSYPEQQAGADRIKEAIDDFPLYQGRLVARDGKVTLVIAEMLNEDNAEQTYAALMDLVKTAPKVPGVELHVAGEGAVAGYMGSYIDTDAQRLNPLAGLVITLIIAFAFLRFSPALLANVIIAASVLMTLSIMAASGVPFYVITNALPVILIGISVADAIHIFSQYFDLQVLHPERDRKSLVAEAMTEMWRPITLTTLTTMAGFFGLYFAAYMPPFKFMGLFSALGVAIAWLFSLLFLPAAMAWIQPKASARFIKAHQQQRPDPFSALMTKLGAISIRNARTTVTISAVIAALGLVAASQLQVDEDRIETFHPSEAIYRADRTINAHLDGTNNLDIVIETLNIEDLFEPENLRKIEALQAYAETLPHVNGSTSIVDYLKQMNRALNEGSEDQYRLPASRESAAQYFLLYSASSDPTDFEEEVDYDYRVANIRLNLDVAAFSQTKPVVESLQAYIDTRFNNDDINATLSGRVTVNYHWIRDLGASHFSSLGIALILVWIVSALLFRSAVAGLYAMLPVVGSLLLIYSAMVILNISLGIGTSMFASVAIGLGVDFAIHTLDRLRSVFAQQAPLSQVGSQVRALTSDEIDQRLMELYPSTGRALLFNFFAIACGFGVLISSQVVPLTNFGIIVALSVTTSFVASMTLLPAMIKVFKPRFIFGASTTNSSTDTTNFDNEQISATS